MLRVIRWLLGVLLVLVVVALAVLRFAPAAFSPLLESLAERAGYALSYDGLSVTFFPLQLDIRNLQVSALSVGEPFVAVADASVTVSPIDYLSSEAWVGGELNTVRAYLDRLPPTEAAASDAGADSDSVELDLAPLSHLEGLVFTNISVFESSGQPALVKLAGSLSPDASDSATGADFSVVGDVMDLAVDVTGRLKHGAPSRLVVSAQRLDVSPLLTPSANTDAEAIDDASSPRQPLDLRPLAGATLKVALADAGGDALSVSAELSLPTFIVEVEIDELFGLRDQVPLADDDVLPLDLAVGLDGEVDRLSFELTSLHWGPNSLNGSGSLEFSPLRIVSVLQAPQLYVPRTQPTPDEPATTAVEPAAGRVFSDAPINWSWLARTFVDVDLNVSELHILDAVFSQVELGVRGENGVLSVAPIDGVFGNGGFTGSLGLTLQGEAVQLISAFNLEGIDLQAFGIVPEEDLTGGALIARIELSGAGQSSAALAGSLDGSILVTVQDAVVQNDTFELIGSDLLMETLNKLNPFARTDPTTRLDCALVQFDVSGGVLQASNSLVVETEKMEIVGDGSIDLGDETLSIGLSPSSRAGVGVNVGSVVKFLKLGGTLSAPKPTADAAGLLKSGAAVGAAMSTGGVSILAEGMFKRLANAGSACERALAGEPILAPEEPVETVDQSSTG
ncbi:MAG: AsmA-like C-terminal region-containing protein [Pseudomonadaceae bacterium]|nr:AsmA-like C-terminal region-containing protein [Pseudomonadaceae bacterium]